jgi:hypothetical protein
MFINHYGKRAWVYIKRYPLHYSGYLIFAVGFFASAKYFKKSESQILRMAFAGSLAQCVTDLILHPIDVINTRTKAEIAEGKVNSWRMIKRISTNEGVFGFWRGASVTYYAALVAGIVYFSVYKFLKTHILKHQTESSGKLHVIAYLSSSLIGEALMLLFYYPYDLIRTRMQTRMWGFNYKGPYDGFKQILDGRLANIKKLYVGATPSFVLCMASQSILFTVLETMREHYIKKLNLSSVNDLPKGIYLLCSIVSGGVAGGLTNMLEVVTINKQVDPQFKLTKFIREQGLKSLTQGLVARVIIHVLHAVLFFYTVDEFAMMFDVEL